MTPAAVYFGDLPNRQETRVAIALLFGHSNSETACELRMGLKTVHFHRRRLYTKFGVHGAGELAAKLTGTAECLPEWLLPQDDDAQL